MTDYNPDKWVVVRNKKREGDYRVFGSWYGGYTGGDSWRMNSGIVKIEEDEKFFRFYGSSGSVYHCHKDAYGASNFSAGILESHKELLEVLPEGTDWHKLELI